MWLNLIRTFLSVKSRRLLIIILVVVGLNVLFFNAGELNKSIIDLMPNFSFDGDKLSTSVRLFGRDSTIEAQTAKADVFKFINDLNTNINANSDRLGFSSQVNSDGHSLILIGSDKTEFGKLLKGAQTLNGTNVILDTFSLLSADLGYVIPEHPDKFYINLREFLSQNLDSDLIKLTAYHEGILHVSEIALSNKQQTLFNGSVYNDAFDLNILGVASGYTTMSIDEIRAWYDTAIRKSDLYNSDGKVDLQKFVQFAYIVGGFKGVKNSVDLFSAHMLSNDLEFATTGQLDTVRVKASGESVGKFFLKHYGVTDDLLKNSSVREALTTEFQNTMIDLRAASEVMAEDVEDKWQAILEQASQDIKFNSLSDYEKELFISALEKGGRQSEKTRSAFIKASTKYSQQLGKYSAELNSAIDYYRKAFDLNKARGFGESQLVTNGVNKFRADIFDLTFLPRRIGNAGESIPDPNRRLVLDEETQRLLVCQPQSNFSKMIPYLNDTQKYKTEDVAAAVDSLLKTSFDTSLREKGIILTDLGRVTSIKNVTQQQGVRKNMYFVNDSARKLNSICPYCTKRNQSTHASAKNLDKFTQMLYHSALRSSFSKLGIKQPNQASIQLATSRMSLFVQASIISSLKNESEASRDVASIANLGMQYESNRSDFQKKLAENSNKIDLVLLNSLSPNVNSSNENSSQINVNIPNSISLLPALPLPQFIDSASSFALPNSTINMNSGSSVVIPNFNVGKNDLPTLPKSVESIGMKDGKFVWYDGVAYDPYMVTPVYRNGELDYFIRSDRAGNSETIPAEIPYVNASQKILTWWPDWDGGVGNWKVQLDNQNNPQFVPTN